ncbi:hypothetical protein [Methanolobus sp. ZRKC5]
MSTSVVMFLDISTKDNEINEKSSTIINDIDNVSLDIVCIASV